MRTCEDCGCRIDREGRCENCHEELYILDQYIEQGMDIPGDETEFMQRVNNQLKIIKSKTTNSNNEKL